MRIFIIFSLFVLSKITHAEVCKDERTSCPVWSGKGYCDSKHLYGKFMSLNCKKSCGLCLNNEISPNIGECGKGISYDNIDSSPPLQGQWPWNAALYMYDEFHCGAVLVDSQHALTAASCVTNAYFKYDTKNFKIVLNDFQRDVKENGEQVISIEKITVHQSYGDLYENDIAILKLQKPANFNSQVGPICLPQKNKAISTKSKCIALGWGANQYSAPKADFLKTMKISLVSQKTCEKKNTHRGKTIITKNMICGNTIGNEFIICRGDNGGPVACLNENGNYVLQGIVSFGHISCDENIFYPVFTSVNHYIDFIKSKITS